MYIYACIKNLYKMAMSEVIGVGGEGSRPSAKTAYLFLRAPNRKYKYTMHTYNKKYCSEIVMA